MSGNKTTIVHPVTEETRDFTFDFSYWSHDHFVVDPETGYKRDDGSGIYASQETVFNDLGRSVMDALFGGYNSCLFAYGQTGSGKSYSMVGAPGNPGIVPTVCKTIFDRINQQKEATPEDSNEEVTYEVLLSIVEIYNEKPRDLLNENAKLVVRMTSQEVRIDGLEEVSVRSYEDIEKFTEIGMSRRSVAQTKMNATSSRAHTITTINFRTRTKTKGTGMMKTLSAKMYLVDLAGSERLSKTGAEGSVMKEGQNINLSLSTLGRVITALVEKSTKPNTPVPYRESMLTSLLRDALGGNSKTLMICALSPADDNYDESLSTLRYANQAKQIKNAVKQNVELSREQLVAKVEKLEAALKGATEEIAAKLRAQFEAEYAKKEAERQEELARLARSEALRNQLLTQATAVVPKSSKRPKLVALSDDDSMSEDDVYFVPLFSGITLVGTKADEEVGSFRTSAEGRAALKAIEAKLEETRIYMLQEGNESKELQSLSKDVDVFSMVLGSGLPGLKARHAKITNLCCGKAGEGGARGSTGDALQDLVQIELDDPTARLYVNGRQIKPGDVVTLKHNDRILFGVTTYFRYEHTPQDDSLAKSIKLATYTEAWNEFQSINKPHLRDQLAKFEDTMKKETAARGMSDAERALFELKNKHEETVAELKAICDDDIRALQAEDMDEMSKKRLIALRKGRYERELATLTTKYNDESAKLKLKVRTELRKQKQMREMQAQTRRFRPLIDEANGMATELKREIQFILRPKIISMQVDVLVVTEDSVLSSNPTVLIEWSGDAFEERFYRMREVYQQYLESGIYTPQTDNEDPFWDKPSPSIIGYAVVYLIAIARWQNIEEVSYPVKDIYSLQNLPGQSSISLIVDLLKPDGEDVVEDLPPGQTPVGQSFVVAIELTAIDNIQGYTNLCVYFDLFGQRYTLPGPTGRVARIHIKDATEEQIETFESQPLYVYLRGMKQSHPLSNRMRPPPPPPPKGMAIPTEQEKQRYLQQLKEAQKPQAQPEIEVTEAKQLDPPKRPLSADTPQPVTPQSAPAPHLSASATQPTQSASVTSGHSMCGRCSKNPAAFNCTECEKLFCVTCDALLHKAPSRAGHARNAVGAQLPAPAAPAISTPSTALTQQCSPTAPTPQSNPTAAASDGGQPCTRCNAAPAVAVCSECNHKFCGRCDSLMHKAPSRQNHARHAVPQGTGVSNQSTPTSSEAKPPSVVPPTPSASTPVSAIPITTPSNSSASSCARCKSNPAAFTCAECDKALCGGCDTLLHKAPSRASHARVPI